MLDLAVSRRPDERMEHFISDCLNCHSICLETVRHLLQLDGRRSDAPFRLLLDCAEICQTGATLLPRSGALDGRLCLVCAEVAESTATACERFGDDPQMKTCAEVCRSMALSSRTFAQASLAG